MDSTIGENIRRLREQRHWSQEQLAGAAAVSARTIQRAERGEPMALETLQAIAGAFDVAIADLKTDPDAEAMRRALARFIVIAVKPAKHGFELARVGGVHGTLFSVHGDLSSQQRDLMAALQENLQDWADIWTDLSPTQQREAEKDLQRHLDELAAVGIVVCAGRERVRFEFQTPSEAPWDIGAVVFAPEGAAPEWALWDSAQGLGF